MADATATDSAGSKSWGDWLSGAAQSLGTTFFDAVGKGLTDSIDRQDQSREMQARPLTGVATAPTQPNTPTVAASQSGGVADFFAKNQALILVAGFSLLVVALVLKK